MRQLLLSIVVLFVWVLSTETRGERPAFPKLLPSETFLMVRLDNAANFREALRNAAVGKLLSDPQMAPFVEQVIGDFGVWVADQGQDFGLQLGELAAIPQGEVGLALVDLNAGNVDDKNAKGKDRDGDEAEGGERRRGPPIDLLLVIEAKERMPYLRGLIEQVETRASEYLQQRDVKGPGNTKIRAFVGDTGREFGWTEREGTFVFSSGLATLERYLEAWDKGEQSHSLASEPAFASALTPCLGSDEKPPQITVFFDPIRLIRAAGRGNASAQVTLQLLEQFGLGNIRGLGGSVLVGAKDYDSLVHTHLVLDGPRTGILGVIQPKSGDLKPEKWMPNDVSQFLALRWDVPATVNGIERVLEKIAGSTFWETSVENRFKERYGVDLQKDVFEQFAGRFTIVQWHEPPARLGSQVMLFAAEMKDMDTAEKTLQQVLEKRKVTEPRETYAGARMYPIRTLRPREDPLIRVGKPTVMCADKYIFVSDSRPLLEKIARTLNDADAPKLQDRAEFAMIAGEINALLDGQTPFYMSYIDPTESLRSIYELAQSPEVNARLRSMGGRFAPADILAKALTDKKLPPIAVVRQYFSPRGSAAYDEPTGIHFFSFSLHPEK